ncbi:response regulator transcription factor [Pontibacter sp. G13]|uniref:response regulator transcription factor n=1 Tax=Pontibacter sp. G13 TaxID=3074898 RepID=UPI00288C2985|nr:response regulator transcription factor [Pontibacter sp. G13]WNJ21192.1 response regulator transcription factor [Pontibacter sp. G13]
MAQTKVLIVDDETDILDLLEYNLEKESYEVLRAMDGEEAISIARDHKPDLIVLDIMMPKLDGIETCRQIREIPGMDQVYIVFLTARSEEYSEVAGFEAGADDYITKPIKPRVLLSRLKAILRRKSSEEPSETLKVHDLEIIRDEYIVKQGDRELTLPRKEFELLNFLAARPGKVFSREILLEKVWGDVFVVDRTVDVHVRKLREKLGDSYIQTVKGVGYKFANK